MVMHIEDMVSNPTGFLVDKLLIATPNLRDGCFDKTVIYLMAHNEQGAMGMIINIPLQALDVRALLDELKINSLDVLPPQPIHFGGPVDTNQGFILHTSDRCYMGTLKHPSDISFSAGIECLKDIARGTGPEKYLVAMGCAGWTSGQLEREIETGSWIVASASPHIVFDTANDHKWAMAAASLGVDLSRLSATVGHA